MEKRLRPSTSTISTQAGPSRKPVVRISNRRRLAIKGLGDR